LNTGNWEREDVVRLLAPIMAAMALALGAIGVLALCGRWETVVERRRQFVTRWWGLGRWRFAKSWPLDGVTHVELEKTVTHGSEGSSTHYPIHLCGEGEKILVARPPSESVARHDAERVAGFLGLELRDGTRGDEVTVRQPEEFDVPIGKRASKESERAALPERPTDLRSTIEPEGADGLKFILPRQGFRPPMAIFAGICFLFVSALTIGGVVMMGIARREIGGDHPFAFALLLPAVGFGVILTGMVIGAVRFRQQVRVSPARVAVTWAMGERGIRADELEEVRVQGTGADWTDASAIMIRSATTTIHFGHHLSRRECDYLAATIRSIVANAGPPARGKQS
jgi:hypothetical protein